MVTALVTGANSGVGFETCRLLAGEVAGPSFAVHRIILVCRSAAKAASAREELVRLTGRSAGTFDTLVMDVADLASVGRAVEAVAANPIDMMVLNAGGMGGCGHLELTPDGITRVMAMNTTGHAAFFEGLLATNKLATDARIIFASSELARGLLFMSGKPVFGLDEGCMTAHLVGTPTGKYERTPAFMSGMSSYAAAKAVGTLYFQQCARENPNLTIHAVSPGSCYGTNAHVGAPRPMQLTNLPLQMYLLSLVGLAHTPSVGAQRYIDTFFCRGTKYPTGTFIASRKWATGAVCDQAVSHADLYSNEALQRTAASAVRSAIA